MEAQPSQDLIEEYIKPVMLNLQKLADHELKAMRNLTKR